MHMFKKTHKYTKIKEEESEDYCSEDDSPNKGIPVHKHGVYGRYDDSENKESIVNEYSDEIEAMENHMKSFIDED